jgi:beta-D-galactosyl-(1->4)-L-rhamnose phosphorylase
LLRAKIDRIGLGGYLSLTLPFPDFNDYIEKISDEFRLIKDYHTNGAPYVIPNTKVYVLTEWGKLRSWTCSGHLHEHPEVDLINVIEALSGMPLDVEFISFKDISEKGIPADAKVIINAGAMGSAWSGGANWKCGKLVAALTEWAYKGGTFIGVNEPSAVCGYDTRFRMAHVLGVDEKTNARICHGVPSFEVEVSDAICDGTKVELVSKPVYIADESTKVLAAENDAPTITMHKFGEGSGVYIASFRHGEINNRTLLNLIIEATGGDLGQNFLTDNVMTECCYYPEGGKLVVINNSEDEQTTTVKTPNGDKTVTLGAFDAQIVEV